MPSYEQFRLPDVGEGLTEAEILQWFVQPGDRVGVNQTIVEIETAKAAVELPCPFDGVVTELLAQPGDTVDVGTPIITVDTDPDATTTGPPVPAGPAAEFVPAPPAEEGRQAVLVGYGVKAAPASRRPRRPGGGSTRPIAPTRIGGLEVGRAVERALAETPVLAKPPVRKLARDLGVDLTTVTPTGPHGTVTRADVEAVSRPGAVAASATPADRREPVRGVRKHMAEAMVASAFSAPHVTEWVAVDVTRTVKLVRRLRDTPGFAEARVTPLLLVARAVLEAVRRTPEINASFDADAQEVVYKGAVNLGIAAATPRGLLVPNVKDAGRLSLPELAEALRALTDTAKEGRTAPADLVGGTFTITNVGVFGVDGGTPIINPGEAAILAVGAFRQRPWVHKGRVRPRWVAELSVSFDHRFVDGALGSRFLADVAAVLEDPATPLLWH